VILQTERKEIYLLIYGQPYVMLVELIAGQLCGLIFSDRLFVMGKLKHGKGKKRKCWELANRKLRNVYFASDYSPNFVYGKRFTS
jgi:hypothetical protein